MEGKVGFIERESGRRAGAVRSGERTVAVRKVAGQSRFLAKRGKEEERLQTGKD